MKALFPSKLEVLDSSFFFSSLKPKVDLCSDGKSNYTEVCIVCDLFRREEVNYLVPYDSRAPRSLSLVFLF